MKEQITVLLYLVWYDQQHTVANVSKKRNNSASKSVYWPFRVVLHVRKMFEASCGSSMELAKVSSDVTGVSVDHDVDLCQNEKPRFWLRLEVLYQHKTPKSTHA